MWRMRLRRSGRPVRRGMVRLPAGSSPAPPTRFLDGATSRSELSFLAATAIWFLVLDRIRTAAVGTARACFHP